VVSKMIHLYEYPVVDPARGVKQQLKMLRSAARDPRVPIVVYPEGTRSRDGELLPFRRGAVDTLLRHRQWKVYLATADGTLPCGRLADMLNGVAGVDCRISVTGPFDTPSNPDEIASWLHSMEGRMRESLAELRASAPPSGTRRERPTAGMLASPRGTYEADFVSNGAKQEPGVNGTEQLPGVDDTELVG
jgi:1-acyl-sn-glycerol-3-phosphate acyltransferase